MAWIPAAQALAALDVQPQTLYANVSRGRIRAKPDPKDSRRSLYHSEDVNRLAARRAGRRTVAAVAAQTIGWGDPVLTSGISTIAQGRLWYRGRDATVLSDAATLEEIAALLWEAEDIRFANPRSTDDFREPPVSPLLAALLALSRRTAADPPSRGRSRAVLAAEAADLVNELVCAMVGGAAACLAPLHSRMAAAWDAPHADDIVRRALVLLADHELNASTFAARVTASTGTPLSAALLAGLATLAGPLHGGASMRVRMLAEAARQTGATEAVRDWLSRGHPLPAFGHPLYADGDPRAITLLSHVQPRPIFGDLRAAVETLTGEQPNIDFAIAAMADAYDLPPTAPFTIFAVARSVGWIAHILEQSANENLIRPRARYVGPPPSV